MVFRTSRRAVAQFVLTTGLFAVVATSCGTQSASSPDLTVNLPTTTVGVQQPGDGVVRIAAFLPSTGPGAQIGTPMNDAVRLAVSDINAAGGVLGGPIEVDFVDESTSNDLDIVLQSDVDAIVGPASSLNALSTRGVELLSMFLGLIADHGLQPTFQVRHLLSVPTFGILDPAFGLLCHILGNL